MSQELNEETGAGGPSHPWPSTMTDPDIIACPYQAYHRLQREAPIFHDPVTGFYEITRYEDVRKVMTDTENFSNHFNLQVTRPPALQSQMLQLYKDHGFEIERTLLDNDPPLHRFARSLVDKAFNPHKIAALEPAIRAEVGRLIDLAIDNRTIEFVEEFAIPLPLNLISDQIGIATQDRTKVKIGSDAMMANANPLSPDDELIDNTLKVIELQNLIADRIERVRECPDDSLLSLVVSSEVGREAPMAFLVSLFLSVLVAGNETTSHALSNVVKKLADSPAHFSAIREDSARAKPFVEECLRLLPPGQGFFRIAKADFELGGVTIPRGATVVPRRAAADVSPEVFKDPLRFDPERSKTPKHLAFGIGPHFCIGHLLARTEMRVSVEEIASRMSSLTVSEEPGAYVRKLGLLDSGVERLCLNFEPSTSAGMEQ